MSESLPMITRNVSQAIEDVREYGLALLGDQISAEQLAQARTAVYQGAEEDKRLGRQADAFGLDYGQGNVRVWNVLNRHKVFAELVEHPAALELLRSFLGWPALLGNLSANIAEPGSDGGALHADQIFVPKPWPPEPQGFNCAWLLDDFTADNGATEVVPGSHLAPDDVDPAELLERAVPVIAPAGSVHGV